MVKTLRFEGYSDDTFGEYAITRDDHDNCASGDPIVFIVRSPGNGNVGLYVVGHYGQRSGGWTIGVEPIDDPKMHEPLTLPPWPIRIGQSKDTPYSPAIYIDAPDDVTVTLFGGDE